METSTVPEEEVIDLSWVEFSEEEDEACMSIFGCSREAVIRVFYEYCCSARPIVWTLCRICWENCYHYNWTDKPIGACFSCGKGVSIIRWEYIR